MNPLSNAYLNEASQGRSLTEGEVSRFTASEVRQAIADLVASDRMDLAQALGDAGMSLYPENEEILAICALLAEARQDWAAAESMLAQLILKQNGDTPLATWQHYIRVLRCLCELPAALQIVEAALMQFPESAELQAEYSFLLEAVGNAPSVESSDLRH